LAPKEVEMPKEVTMARALKEVRSKPSVSIPVAGRVIADIGVNASYEHAKLGRLGVPVIVVGGGDKSARYRVASVHVLRKVGLINNEGPQAA
jgi:hypothetical protein